MVEFLEVVQTLVRDAARLPTSRGRRGAIPWIAARLPTSRLLQRARWRIASRVQRSRLLQRAKSWIRRPTELAGPYAFIAADGRWIRSSYESRYDKFKQTAAPGRPLGYLFLEKIFQLQVRLPSITASARKSFLASLLVPGERPSELRDAQEDLIRTAKEAVNVARNETEVIDAAKKAVDIADPVERMRVLGDAAVRFSERAIEGATEHALVPFGAFLEPNPRSMKLFVNTYGVLRSLRTLEEIFVPIKSLALWTVIEIRWPYLADYLRLHPDIVGQQPADRDVPDDVGSLLLEKDVKGVLGDPGSGHLTPELIRQCSGSLY